METQEILLITTYCVYLVISIAMTIWVARTLFRHGGAFLVDAFRGKAELADSVNRLLVVGFYLVNLGYVSLMLKEQEAPLLVAEAIEMLSRKLGWVLLILGALHLTNVYVFSRVRGSALLDRLVPLGDAPTQANKA